MCISAQQAEFEGTSILVNRTEHPKTKEVMEVVGYENTAENRFRGPNALLLHFPAMEMGPENFIDSQGCTGIFDDLKRATMPDPVSKGLLRGFSASAFGSDSVQVFEHGIYTVLLAKDARDIPSALIRVPAEKRPSVSEELCEFYAKYRQGWPIALCCFENQRAQKSEPVFVWYKPKNPEVMVAPGLDSHTGGVPNMQAKVDLDHRLYFAADGMANGNRVTYSGRKIHQKMNGFLPSLALGVEMNYKLENGDFVVSHQELMRGRLTVRRFGFEDPVMSQAFN